MHTIKLWPPVSAATLRPGSPARSASTAHRRLIRAAGFYRREIEAQRAARTLRERCGLGPSQLVVLGPDETARRSLFDGRAGSTAVIGAVSAAVLAGLAVLLDPALHGWEGAMLVAGLAALAALAGGVIDRLIGQVGSARGQSRRFDRTVERQRATGAWTLLVQHVALAPPSCQVRVLGLLQGSSRHWCADAPRGPRP